jgi:pyruvate dehydrogenase E2 component (dihydrolipoamide acetyltransferase)
VVPVTTIIAYILKEGESSAELPQGNLSITQPLTEPVPIEGSIAAVLAAPVSATPVAARMAKAEGVDLSKVTASGEKITRQDVEHYLANQNPAGRVAVAATPAARRVSRETGIALEAVPGTGPRGRVQSADVQMAVKDVSITTVNGRPAEVIELTGIRHTIAERMQSSFQEIPHIALTIEVDVTALENLRRRLNALTEKREENKISMTALIVRTTAWALEQNPYINASLIDRKIHLWKDVNIGIATALDKGLIVPVIHEANRHSLHELAQILHDLTNRAREGTLSLRDVQHGTFTISNLGMYGIKQFRAIINPPESAILAVGTVLRKPVVINDRDEVAVRPMMSITLSADHRVIDGVVAARFLQNLAQAIEMPELLLY